MVLAALEALAVYNMKYYFIYYSCNQTNWTGGKCYSHESMCQAITKIHPIQWQIDVNDKYERTHDDGHGGTKSEAYRVISWQELSKEEYNQFEGRVG